MSVNKHCKVHEEYVLLPQHYNDVMMTTVASPITSLAVVYSIVYSDADERKHQSSASLAFVRGIHRDRWFPRTKGQWRGKCFHLMTSSWYMNFLWKTNVWATQSMWQFYPAGDSPTPTFFHGTTDLFYLPWMQVSFIICHLRSRETDRSQWEEEVTCVTYSFIGLDVQGLLPIDHHF